MATISNNRLGPLRGTLAGFRLGVRFALPVMPGMFAFGLAVGATAARKGFSFIESLLMNLFVYAGMSQLVAMEVWPERLTMAALGALALMCATINARMLLITASLQPWLGAMPPWQIYPALHLTVDPGWLIAMRYRAEDGSDIGVFFGSGVMLAFTWMSATSVGYFAGALVSDPRALGIDLVMPVFFAAMLIPLWRGARRAAAWVIAGVVALLVQQFLGGWWFAGSVAGGFLDGD
jgi:predicted branched-subunit amino acid permease